MSAKTYRNLAITKFNKQDFTSATIITSLGHDLDPKVIPEGMVNAAANKANGEVATVAEPEIKQGFEFDYRAELGQMGSPVVIDGVDEKIRTMVDMYSEKKLMVLPTEGKFIWFVDYANQPTIKKIDLQGTPRAATFVGGRLFVSITSPHRIAELDVKSGDEIQRWQLTEAAPKSLAVAPKHNMAFYCNNGVIRILDMKTGQQTMSRFDVTKVVSDPKQNCVYAFRTPPGKSNQQRGHFLIRGKPVYFTIENEQFDWSQSTMFKFLIGRKQLLISQVRINAASNAKDMVVSPDGEVVAIVGGGGWRPLDESSGRGYGVPFFKADDFGHVLRYVPTGAYPTTAAISPLNHLIYAGGGKRVLSHVVNDDSIELDIKAKPACARFTGDGRWLFLATGAELSAIKLELNNEDKSKTGWWKSGASGAKK